MTPERVEIVVMKDRATATLFVCDRKITSATVMCALGDWASGTEGIYTALVGLARVIMETHPPGIVIRDPTMVMPKPE
jgi:hypothetical protein